MITVELFNNHGKVSDPSRKIHAVLDSQLAEYLEGYNFSDKYRRGFWDGKKHFYSRLSGIFGLGLIYRVLKIIKSTRSDYKIVNSRELSGVKIKTPNRLQYAESEKFRQLRDYQLEAVEALIHNKIGVLKAATNAGKTEIYAECLRRLGLSAVFICTRKELFHQTADRLERRLGFKVGRVGDGLKSVKPITVVMPTTAIGKTKNKYTTKSEFKELLKADILILDECQNITDSRVSTFCQESGAYYRFAGSGTPFLKDKCSNLLLESQFGRIVKEITNEQLIQLGVSSVPSCFFIKTNSDMPISGMDYDQAYQTGIVQNTYRNQSISKLVSMSLAQHKTCLVIVSRIEHLELLRLEIPGANFSHGGCSAKHRMQVLKEFQQGNIKALLVSNIYDLGIDTDQIDVVINAAGMKTPERVLQRLGRGLRQNESGRVWYFDFLDADNEYLYEHATLRLKTLEGENFEVKILSNPAECEF